MQLKHFILSFNGIRAITGTLFVLSTNLIAAPPETLTAAQLNELDQLARPLSESITREQEDSQKILDEDATRSDSTDDVMRPFLESIGQKALLVQSPQVTPTPPVAPAVEPTDPNDPKKPTVTTLKVECDGGLYFDNENGVLAYLKNVRLTEPRFKLTCSDELKVFLDQKPVEPELKPRGTAVTPKPVTQDKAATDKAAADTKKKDKSLASFGDLKRIVATGNVKVVQKDDKGKLFIASAGVASYDAKTGEMILKGGLPRLQQSKNQYLQAQEPGQWIRIHKSGKLITSKGKWVMQTTTKKPTP